MRKTRKYSTLDTVFSFVASFIESTVGVVERCDLIQMNFIYTEMSIELLFDHNEAV